MQGAARAFDAVARLGGDEFGFILSGLVPDADGQEIVARMIQTIERPVDIGGHTVSVSASVGIAMFPTDGDDPEKLFALADNRMYINKRQRKQASKA